LDCYDEEEDELSKEVFELFEIKDMYDLGEKLTDILRDKLDEFLKVLKDINNNLFSIAVRLDVMNNRDSYNDLTADALKSIANSLEIISFKD
jgi:hypothetical protein